MPDATPTVDAPSKPRRFRRTRIAVSVFFGLVAVALCVLWVRSYWRSETVLWTSRAGSCAFEYVSGSVGFGIYFNGSFEKLLPIQFLYIGHDVTEDERSKLAVDTVMGFAIYRGLCTILLIPFWCAVLGTASLSMTHWISVRFSLRTLLIATTLVAVFLGLESWLAS